MADGNEGVARVVALVGPYCDLEDRLREAPPSACIRGVWFRVFLTELEEHGLLADYERYFPEDSFSGLKFYAVADYLPRIALAGALMAGPENVYRGMFELNRGNAKRFATSLLGRTLFRLLSNDPQRLLQQGIASRRQTMTYGRWVLTSSAPDECVVIVQEEYIWIDPNVVGSAVGTFEAIGRTVDIDVKYDSKFDAVIRLKIA